MLPPVDYPVGIIAGNRSIYPVASALLPKPNDGRVSVERTKLDGMADHIVIGASHPWLPRNRLAIEQTIAFLRDGRVQPIVIRRRSKRRLLVHREDELKAFDWHGDPISRATPITKTYRNTQNVRRFFQAMRRRLQIRSRVHGMDEER